MAGAQRGHRPYLKRLPAMTEPALPPGSTIGILGGGQLGRMLASAAAKLGFNCRIFCEKPDAPAFETAASHVCAAYDDRGAIEEFASQCDAITFEFENVPLEAANAAASCAPLYPGVRTLEVSQDRLNEKRFMEGLSIPVAPFMEVASMSDLEEAVSHIGLQTILKTRRLGYDGKGQVRIKAHSDLSTALEALNGAPAILEGFIPFTSEVSIFAARGASGEFAAYDLTENHHENHILKESRVPARVPASCTDEAISIARRIGDALDYTGIFCVELFYCGEDATHSLLVNEIAPRVHNSGHWTLDGCAISQFENHIRAVAGWPLGSCERHSDAVMTNLLGEECENWRTLAGQDGTSLHMYGKKEARKGRKMGHFTRLSPRQA